jgi:hypothetical protein
LVMSQFKGKRDEKSQYGEREREKWSTEKSSNE